MTHDDSERPALPQRVPVTGGRRFDCEAVPELHDVIDEFSPVLDGIDPQEFAEVRRIVLAGRAYCSPLGLTAMAQTWPQDRSLDE